MPIEPTKPMKQCKFCLKEVSNLGLHIVNQHPTIMEQLEEKPIDEPILRNYTTPQQPNRIIGSDINVMIREKLDMMLNIKIIEMLSRNSEVSLGDIQKMTQPPQNTSLQEVKALHDMIYSEKQSEQPDNSNQWLSLINGALPIVAQMLPQKKQEVEKNVEHRTNEEGSLRILQPIQEETAGDRTEPSSIGEEPRTIIQTEQPDNSSIKTISEWTK